MYVRRAHLHYGDNNSAVGKIALRGNESGHGLSLRYFMKYTLCLL